MSSYNLKGKVVVVTGGNSGIGLATAKLAAEQGAKVAIFGRNKDTLASAAKEIGAEGLAVAGDVTKIDDIDRLFTQVREKFGKVDALIANAGIAKMAPLSDTTEELYDQIMDINVKGVFFTVKRAASELADGGSIVLTTSAVSTRGFAGFSVYAATKAALRSMTRSFAAELIGRKIRVNALSPGPVETPIFSRMGLPAEAVQQMSGEFAGQVPLGRFGRPEEMAQAALFLASDASSYVVGAELAADGGFSQL